jgi:Flp pilus assembly protein TadD
VQRLWGELALARGEPEEALERLGQAAALNSRDPVEQLALSAAYRKAGNEAAAERHRLQAERLLEAGLQRQP